MTAYVLRGDARRVPLPDECVDLVLTSFPYWGLRDYSDQGGSLAGQIGGEASPGEWLENVWACMREIVRVVKPEGNIFINLGDKYSERGHGPNRGKGTGCGPQATMLPQSRGPREKSLLGLPWRFALGCMDDLDLILRRDIIWDKTSAMPESVKDRVATRHEYLFHFVRRPRYFSAVDVIREPHTMKPQRRPNGHKARQKLGVLPAQTFSTSQRGGLGVDGHPLGKLPGSVWPIAPVSLIPPQHLDVDHHAHFPPELCRRVILGWSPAGVCTGCGQGRRPVVETAYDTQGRTTNGPQSVARRHESPGRDVRAIKLTTITGYTCACPAPGAPAHPGIVFDPFGGSGTTALVADVLGRTGITMDLSHDYGRLARWRITDPAERARAMGVPKPPPVTDGQGELFDPCGEAS